MAVTRDGRGRRVWEAGFVTRLVRPVVVGARDVPLFGALLGVLRGVAISNRSLGAQTDHLKLLTSGLL